MDYPSNLTNKEWQLIKHYFVYGNYGNRSQYDKRDLVNAVFYLVKSGCQWRMLPHDFPPWKTVYSFYRRAKEKGVWEQMMHDLVKYSRLKMGRLPGPSYGIIDSQSVKTTDAAEERGIDGGKKIKGHKRHIVTDTQGYLLHVRVHAANIHDTVAGCRVFKEALDKYPTLQGVCADGGYRKTLEEFVQKVLGKTIEIAKRITFGWVILAKRWVVERTFAWLNHFRRLSKDYEIKIRSAENVIMVAHSRLLLKRLCRS